MNPNNPYYKSNIGRIYIFDFERPDVPPQVLPIDWNGETKSITPHGISLWTDQKTGKFNILFFLFTIT